MAVNRTAVHRKRLQGLSKGSTYRFSPDIAFELELYGLVRKYGSQRQIIEQSLFEFFDRHPIPSELRDAALLILNGVDEWPQEKACLLYTSDAADE